MLSANKKRIKYEIKMFLALTIASAVIAFNLKIFVQTGGLFPGGFSGLTILFQQVAERYFGLKIA